MWSYWPWPTLCRFIQTAANFQALTVKLTIHHPAGEMVPRDSLCSPVGDDAMLNRVLEGEDAALRLSLIAHICIFLAHAHHDT